MWRMIKNLSYRARVNSYTLLAGLVLLSSQNMVAIAVLIWLFVQIEQNGKMFNLFEHYRPHISASGLLMVILGFSLHQGWIVYYWVKNRFNSILGVEAHGNSDAISVFSSEIKPQTNYVYQKYDLLVAWFLPNLWIIGFTLLGTVWVYWLIKQWDYETIVVERELNRLENIADKQSGKRPINVRGNSLILGVSRSGKTAGLNMMIRNLNGNVLIIDGKGDTERYSMYDQLELLGKPFSVLNGTNAIVNHQVKWNPFADIKNSQELTDFLSSMVDLKSDGDGQYYFGMFRRYASVVSKMLFAAGVKLSMENVVKALDETGYKALVGMIDDLKLVEEASDVFEMAYQDSVGGIQRLIADVDTDAVRKIISHEGVGLNELLKRGPVIMLLDQFTMPYMAKVLASLILKGVGQQISAVNAGQNVAIRNSRLDVILDEFNVYGTPEVLPLLNKGMGANVYTHISTQSLNDLDHIDSKELTGQFLDNMISLVLYRINDADSAERIANMIGTRLHITTTSRANDAGLSGEGSVTSDNEYIVPVDDFKTQKTNTGIYVDLPTKQIIRFKNELV